MAKNCKRKPANFERHPLLIPITIFLLASSENDQRRLHPESLSIFLTAVFFQIPDKPMFKEEGDELKVFTVVEGESMVIDLKADANPGPIEYKWSRTGGGGISIPTVADALPQSRIIDMVRQSLQLKL